LIDAQKLINWDSFMPILEKYYNLEHGKPGINPVLMLKLEYLRYHFNLSDRQVIERADTDLLLRWFLQIPLSFRLPDASTQCEFRGRIGAEGFKKIFNQLIAKAREAGIVKDRLRLKDASHVIANIAVPTTIKLIGQLRDRNFVKVRVHRHNLISRLPASGRRVGDEGFCQRAIHDQTQ
jgi:transposase